jgi:hypothetical protein
VAEHLVGSAVYAEKKPGRAVAVCLQGSAGRSTLPPACARCTRLSRIINGSTVTADQLRRLRIPAPARCAKKILSLSEFLYEAEIEASNP